jgi:hypothetical protein
MHFHDSNVSYRPGLVIGEAATPLAMWLGEQRHNLKDGLLEKSKLAKHAYERIIG